MKSYLKSQRGISVVTVIIIVAFIYAGLTVYSFYEPSFELSRYTPIYFLKDLNDETRKKDLQKIADALDQYQKENNDLPGANEFCGRIFSVLHPVVKSAISPYFPDGIPQDPTDRGTHKDYFYRKHDRDSYILMAVLENPPENSPAFNFEGCHDWPGDNIYNYVITNG